MCFNLLFYEVAFFAFSLKLKAIFQFITGRCPFYLSKKKKRKGSNNINNNNNSGNDDEIYASICDCTRFFFLRSVFALLACCFSMTFITNTLPNDDAIQQNIIPQLRHHSIRTAHTYIFHSIYSDGTETTWKDKKNEGVCVCISVKIYFFSKNKHSNPWPIHNSQKIA